MKYSSSPSSISISTKCTLDNIYSQPPSPNRRCTRVRPPPSLNHETSPLYPITISSTMPPPRHLAAYSIRPSNRLLLMHRKGYI